MTIEHDELKKLVPHAGKMLLIDRVCDFDTENWSVKTQTTVRENCIFFEKSIGGIPNYIFIEFVAQSVAALLGICSKTQGKKNGYILSVSSLEISVPALALNSKVGVFAHRTSEAGNAHSFCAELFVDDKNVGSGNFTLMVAE